MITNKKSKYIVEYKIEGNIYNLVVKGKSEEHAAEVFEKKWLENVGEIYPFPKYEVVSIKRFFNKIKIR